MKKLAIVTTHPIQYNAPWFKMLSQQENIYLKVFYTWSQTKDSVKDRVFGKEISWDIPLLDGYNYEFVENKAKNPGSHHFRGINCPSLVATIENFNSDAIIVFGWNFLSHLKVMRYFKGKIPIWFRGDSTLIDENGGLKMVLRRLILSNVYKYIDKALYVGKANKAYFLKHGIKPKQLKFVPHAIDNNRFSDEGASLNEKAYEWRKRLGYNPGEIVILFVGKFEEKKQPMILIEALNETNLTHHIQLNLLFVGDGPMKDILIEKAKDRSNIKFLPFQNQSKMPLVYRLGDITCLPSKGPGETWGLAVNESMACGRPVVVSNKVGCSQDLVKHNENGFVFNYKSVFELADILSNLNRGLCEKLGKQALRDIKFWSFAKQTESIIALLKEK